MQNRSGIALLALLVLFLAVGIYFYPQMPERMASHWNAQGQVDGYTSRFWGVFLLPIIAGVMALLLWFIPRLDPLRSNVEQFRAYYHRFVLLLVVFLFYLYILTLLWNTRVTFNMLQLLAPAFGVLFYYTGVMVEKAPRNWFIGVRTPWTLSNERVWNKTHRLGGKLFKAGGVLAVLGAFFPQYAVLFILVPALLVALVSVVYSYVEFRRETRV